MTGFACDHQMKQVIFQLMMAFSGESHFYSGDEFRKHLRTLIETASVIDIATAWVSESNLLKLLVSDGIKATIRMIVDVGGYTTDPVVLKKLGARTRISPLKFTAIQSPLSSIPSSTYSNINSFVGSMNFTNAGTTKNIESMLSIEDKHGTAGQEFERFWNSSQAVAFDKFDLVGYEAKRRPLLAKVKAVGRNRRGLDYAVRVVVRTTHGARAELNYRSMSELPRSL